MCGISLQETYNETMRTIKFRAWIPKLKYFCKHVLFEDDVAVALHNDDGFGYPIPADQCVIQQYTGLKDTKGVEIYEGDLVKEFPDEEEVYEVKYCVDSEGCHFILDNTTQEDWGTNLTSDGVYEVVGNIFENQEK
jgi:uncharacterized phage protein (TIGR01671 family)